MKKLLITLAVAAMAVGGLAVGVSAAGGRDAVSRPNPTVRQADGRLDAITERLTKLRVRCVTLSCVNKSLTRLANAVKNITKEMDTCQKVISVSQYGDFEQYPDTGPITGLDYTDPTFPGTPQNVMIWTCAVV